MKIWVKISDIFGFIGVSNFNNVDEHYTDVDLKTKLGLDTDKLSELNNTNYLTDETISYLGSIGWILNEEFFKSNGDVHAFCFEKHNTMILDERTFGDSPAAIDMVRIINERGLDSRKAGRLLNRFDKITNDINHVGITSAIHLMHLLYKESCEKCEAFEEPLNTYTKNVLATKFKLWQLRKGALTPKKNRKS